MARYDVYQMADLSLVLDLQADALDHLNTRLVAPLLLNGTYQKPISRANPDLEVDGQSFVLLPNFLAAVPVAELRQRIANVDHEQYKISSALDMLFCGF